MFSILVPIYNYDVTKLAQDLSLLSEKENRDCELVFADDFSSDKELAYRNKVFLSSLPNTRYIELKENFGRSKIRNFLADQANGEWLLFLDCDSGVVREDFLHNYISQTKQYDIVCGGTVYCPKSAISREYLLHWKNGKQREEQRKHFTTNNFMIRKEIFRSVRFNEQIKGYGHEDTLFACELAKHNYNICFADNPVEHLGLKETDRFISDTINASRNLAILYKNPKYKDFLGDLSLIKAYKKLNALHIAKVYAKVFPFFRVFFVRQLHSSRPCLRFLDLIKLYSVCSV